MSDTAVQKLELAKAWLDEVDDAFEDLPGPFMTPDPSNANFELANELLARLNQAERNLQEATRLDPDAAIETDDGHVSVSYLEWVAISLRGKVLGFVAGKRSQGAKLLERAVAEVPRLALTHALLGFLYIQMGQKQRGLESIRKAIDLDPDNTDLRKTADVLEQTSELRLKFNAFRGSWKTVGCLSILALFILFAMVAALMSGEIATAIFGIIVFVAPLSGIIYLYWRWKSQ